MLLKKLLAILLIGVLYAPNAARLVMYAECTLQANSTQQCDCNLSNIPNPKDQQAPSPEKQKEIQQQTDWKYLIIEKQACTASLFENRKTYTGSINNAYSFAFISSIFRPPCCRHKILS